MIKKKDRIITSGKDQITGSRDNLIVDDQKNSIGDEKNLYCRW